MLPVVVFVLGVMPTGLAYWLIPKSKKGETRMGATAAKVFGFLVLLAASAAILAAMGVRPPLGELRTHAIPSHAGPGRCPARRNRFLPRQPWQFGDTAACPGACTPDGRRTVRAE